MRHSVKYKWDLPYRPLTSSLTKKSATIAPTLLAVAIAQTLWLTGAQAASIVVDNAGDAGVGCTLRDAVHSINAGTSFEPGCSNSSMEELGTHDQISFSVASVNLDGSIGAIPISKDLIINGNDPHVVINGDGTSGLFSATFGPVVIYMDKLTLQGGNAAVGGAISVSQSIVTISNSELKSNTASSTGGAISANLSSVLNLNDSTVSENSAASDGGIRISGGSTLNLTDSQVSANVTDGTISQGGGGGIGIRGNGSQFNMIRSTVTGNTASRNGGGVYFLSGTIGDIKESTISGNSSALSGGGLGISVNSIANIADSTVSGNTAIEGGNIVLYSSTAFISNSTISGGLASNDTGTLGFGGGLSVRVSSELELTNSTVADNTDIIGTNGGSISVDSSSAVVLRNTIVTSLSSPDCTVDASSTITANDKNIIEDGSCATSALNVDPGLGSLANNGGLTKTYALREGSPAIDAGDNAVCAAMPVNNLDQRGRPRPVGNSCDIGAIEFSGGSFFIVPSGNGKTAIFYL